MTLDDAIAKLIELRSVWPGEIPVVIDTYVVNECVNKIEVRRIYTDEKCEQPRPVIMINGITCPTAKK